MAERHGIDKAAVSCMRRAAEMARSIELDNTVPETQSELDQQPAYELLVKRQEEALSQVFGQALPTSNLEAFEGAIREVADQVLAITY